MRRYGHFKLTLSFNSSEVATLSNLKAYLEPGVWRELWISQAMDGIIPGTAVLLFTKKLTKG